MNVLAVIEVLWTIFAVLGVGVSIYNLFDVLTDLKVLSRSNMNGLRLMVAKGNIRSEITRLVILMVFVGIGLLALSQPNPPSEITEVRSWVIRIGLILVNVAVVYNTIADRLLRHNIFNFAESMENRVARHREEARVAEEGERRVATTERRRGLRESELPPETTYHDIPPATKRGDRTRMGRIEASLDRLEEEDARVAVNLEDDKYRADLVADDPDAEAGEAADTYSTSRRDEGEEPQK